MYIVNTMESTASHVPSQANSTQAPGLSPDADTLWKMEEYKALRAEVLANHDFQKNLVVFGTAGLATAFGFVFRDLEIANYRYALLTLIEIVALGFWYTWAQHGYATERIGTYKSLNLETDSPLNWELFQRCSGSPEEDAPRTRMTDGKHKAKHEQEPIKSRRGRLLTLVTTVPFIVFSLICLGMVVADLPTGKLPLWQWSGGALQLSFQLISLVAFLATVGFVLYIEVQVKSSESLVTDTTKRLGICLSHRSTGEEWQRFTLPRAERSYVLHKKKQV